MRGEPIMRQECFQNICNSSKRKNSRISEEKKVKTQ